MSEMLIPANASVASKPSLPVIIGVRFMRVGKLYHFDASGHPQVKPGDRVIVETTRGRQLAEVVNFVDLAKTAPPEGGYKAIEGIASARDLAMQQMWQSKETEALINCRERAHQLALEGVKIVKAEYSYDGARLTFLISGSGDDGKV